MAILRALTETEWDTAGADVWRNGPPLVESTLYDGLQTLRVVLDDTSPATHGGIPIAQLGPKDLEVYMERPSDGHRHEANGIRGEIWVDDGSVSPRHARGRQYSDLSEPPWIADLDEPNYYLGLAGRVWLPDPNEPGGFEFVVRVPYCWWAVDVGLLLFVFARFYSPGESSTLDYMDKEAAVSFSRGVHSYLRRRRLFTWRRTEETLIDHLKRLALDSGAMLRWGGFQSGSDTVQQLGLGPLDWDSFREVTTVHDADPSGDAGRDMFQTEPIIVRTAPEYILNRVRSRWGGGWAQSFQSRGGAGGSVYEVATEFPFLPVSAPPLWLAPDDGPPNQYEDEDTGSQILRGERSVERDLPSTIDPESGDSLHPFRWVDPVREVEWAMGPGHWDFDTGDIIHLRHVGLGLDGTEDLLVLSKTIQWETLHATIRALEVRQDPEPMEPTDLLLGDSCIIWLPAVSHVGNGTGGIALWIDQSGAGNHAYPRSGVQTPTQTSQAEGISGFSVLDFAGAGVRGLEMPGLSLAYFSALPVGITIIAVVKFNGPTPAAGWVFTMDPAGQEWGMGTTGSGDVVALHNDTQETSGEDSAVLVDRWHIITVVLSNETGTESLTIFDIMKAAQNYGAGFGVDPPASFDIANLAFGMRSSSSDASLDGKLAEFQLYTTRLRPHYIRRLHANIRARYSEEVGL